MDVKKRDSNLELLRIIAMLFVLMVHASFRALDAPTEEDIAVAPLSSFLRFFSESVLGFHDFHNSGNFFCNGYTPLSFAGLYLLARYLRLYPVKLSTLNKLYDIAIYLCTVLATTFLSMVLVGQTGMNGWNLYSYLSPLVILSSLYFFLFFTKLSFYSKSINWIASSAFAVYLLHCDPLFFDTHYLAPIKRWYINDTMLVFLLHISILIIALFGGALLVDRIRIILWNKCLILYKQFGGKHD